MRSSLDLEILYLLYMTDHQQKKIVAAAFRGAVIRCVECLHYQLASVPFYHYSMRVLGSSIVDVDVRFQCDTAAGVTCVQR